MGWSHWSIENMVDQGIIDVVKKYVMLVPKSFGVKRVYVFGSFAKGQAHEASDIDIALVLANLPDFFDAQKRLMQLRRKVDLRIEPHPIKLEDFNDSNPFADELVRTGVEIEWWKAEVAAAATTRSSKQKTGLLYPYEFG